MLLLAAIVSSASPPLARAVASASVRIERPVSIGEKVWERFPSAQRREIVVRDEQGRAILLRLIENQ